MMSGGGGELGEGERKERAEVSFTEQQRVFSKGAGRGEGFRVGVATHKSRDSREA